MKKLIKSFTYAFRGIASAFESESNMRFHLFAANLVVAFGLVLQVSRMEWCLLILCIALVFCMEIANTSIEKLTDLSSPDIHPLAGKAKDLAAGAVLVSALGSAVIAGIIFIPKLLNLFPSVT